MGKPSLTRRRIKNKKARHFREKAGRGAGFAEELPGGNHSAGRAPMPVPLGPWAHRRLTYLLLALAAPPSLLAGWAQAAQRGGGGRGRARLPRLFTELKARRAISGGGGAVTAAVIAASAAASAHPLPDAPASHLHCAAAPPVVLGPRHARPSTAHNSGRRRGSQPDRPP